MKKIRNVLSALFIATFLTINVMAESQSADLFYCEYTSEAEKIVKSIQSQSERYTKRYVEEFYLQDEEVYDESKVSYCTDKMIAERSPSAQEYIELMNTDDLVGMLEKIEVDRWIYPVYYDGVLLTEYMDGYKAYTEEDGTIYYRNAAKGNRFKGNETTVYDKEQLLEYWESQNLSGYEPIQTLKVHGYSVTLAEKDGERYTVLNDFLPPEAYQSINLIQKNHPDLYAQKVWNVKETETAFAEYLISAEPIESEERMYGAVEENSTQAVSKQSKENKSKLWLVLSIGIAVVFAAGMIILVFKKKKKRKEL